jgi:hypothetical protein
MSIINLIVIITDVGMWVTPKRLTDEVYYKHLWSYPHLNIRQTNAFRSLVILIMMMKSKKGKAAVLTTNRFSLQAGIKPP